MGTLTPVSGPSPYTDQGSDIVFVRYQAQGTLVQWVRAQIGKR